MSLLGLVMGKAATGGGGGGPSVVDTFDRADSGDLGVNWVDVQGGGHNITSNAAKPVASGADEWSKHITPVGTSDMFAEVNLTASSNGNWAAQVAARMPDSGTAGTGYVLLLIAGYAGAGLYVSLNRFVNGVETTMVDSGGPIRSAPLADTYTMKISCVGSTIKGYVDSVEVLSTTDTTITSGSCGGIRCFTDNVSNYSYLDFAAGTA